jgi:hypothetical protein
MRVIPETYTIIHDAGQREVSLIMAGLRFVMPVEEARQIASGVLKAVSEASGIGATVTADAEKIGRSGQSEATTPGTSPASSPEAVQLERGLKRIFS